MNLSTNLQVAVLGDSDEWLACLHILSADDVQLLHIAADVGCGSLLAPREVAAQVAVGGFGPLIVALCLLQVTLRDNSVGGQRLLAFILCFCQTDDGSKLKS